MGAITWRNAGVYVLVALPVLGLAGITVIAQQQQDASQPTEDPVAVAARKAREQKKDAPKPKKVYTNEDVSSAAAAPAAPSATGKEEAPAAGEAKATPEGEEKPENGAATPGKNKNDEATWRARFKDARERLADAEKELDILQREANKAQSQFYSDPQKALAEQYSRKDINDHDTKIAAKKEEIAQLKQRLSEMEDELRKAGGDLGWSRE
jgi:hypothetical protein